MRRARGRGARRQPAQVRSKYGQMTCAVVSVTERKEKTAEQWYGEHYKRRALALAIIARRINTHLFTYSLTEHFTLSTDFPFTERLHSRYQAPSAFPSLNQSPRIHIPWRICTPTPSRVCSALLAVSTLISSTEHINHSWRRAITRYLLNSTANTANFQHFHCANPEPEP